MGAYDIFRRFVSAVNEPGKYGRKIQTILSKCRLRFFWFKPENTGLIQILQQPVRFIDFPAS